MAISCPACGKENADSALDCVRCRAPLRDEEPAPDHEAAHQAAPAHDAHGKQALADSLGEVCRRCETYNEPGQRRCTTCGYVLIADEIEPAAEHGGAPDPGGEERTPPQAFEQIHGEPAAMHADTPREGSNSVQDELAGLALSSEEAAEAGSSNGHLHEDSTPREGLSAVAAEELPAPQPGKPAQPEMSAGAMAPSAQAPRRAPAKAPEPPPPAPAPEQKSCASCGSMNPPAARFCFDCGTPFKKTAPPPAAREPEPVKAEPAWPIEPIRPIRPIEPVKPLPRAAEPQPSIHVELGAEEALHDEPLEAAHADEHVAVEAESTAEQQAVSVEAEEHPMHASTHDDAGHLEHAPPEEAFEAEEVPEEIAREAPADEAPQEVESFEEAPPALEEESAEAFEVAEAAPEPTPEPEPELAEEAPPPFHAAVVIERGAAAGSSVVLGHLENALGGAGAAIELLDDPHLAPLVATLMFAEDRLILRDEGTSNGVFVKVRESAPLEPGDHFIAGERLLRFDGPCELTPDHEGDTPFLGAPRPSGPATVRITEVLAGGRTGRTCHRSGPAIAVGRTGCDLNFASDALLGPRHAEVRLGEDGSATLVDLGASESGLFLRMRSRGLHDVQAGDVIQLGDHAVRVEVG